MIRTILEAITLAGFMLAILALWAFGEALLMPMPV
jgi:hypothetical protein